MNIVIVDRFFAEAYRAALSDRFAGLSITTGTGFSDVAPAIPDAEVVFALGHLFADEWVSRAARLRWIQALTTGTDAIEALATLHDDVLVTSTRGIHAPQMSEMAFIHMLALTHRVPAMLANQQRRVWERWPQSLLYQKHVVILGTGTIAMGLARRCQAFDMKVTGVSATPRDVEHFDQVVGRESLLQTLPLADYVVCLLPATAATERLVDDQFLSTMKPGAFFINMSRGSIVDEPALLDALRTRRIGGAGLDAFQVEPLPVDHPFWTLDNVVLSPKHGGTTDIYVDQAMPILAHNMDCYLRGQFAQMKNLVPMPRQQNLSDRQPGTDHD